MKSLSPTQPAEKFFCSTIFFSVSISLIAQKRATHLHRRYKQMAKLHVVIRKMVFEQLQIQRDNHAKGKLLKFS